MAVVINFSSPGNPPNNIVGFNIERSKRSNSGTIALSGDVNNLTKLVTVTFGTTPGINELIGDQMHINGLLYTIIANTTSTITFSPTTDLSTITSFPASFIILNDLAQFSTYEFVGSVTPTIPFLESSIQQFSDSTGTIFDFYQIKTVDSGGNISTKPLTSPFRPGQVINLAIDEKRRDPKDTLKGVIGGSITFEVTVMLGGRRQDPKDNIVYAQLFSPSYLSPSGQFTTIATLPMVRVGLAQYRVTWTIPTHVTANLNTFPLYPGEEYVVSYKANLLGLVPAAVNALTEIDSEFFSLVNLDAPVAGNFPPYATVDDLRMTHFAIDSYLPEAINRTDVESRNKVLYSHLQFASDKLREELNLHQLRSNSSDRREYVCARAVYTILMASKGANLSAEALQNIDDWKERAEYILAQLKREGIAQGIPLGRG